MSKSKKILIGMIHLPPLVGYPNYPGLKRLIAYALSELGTLEKAGYDGVLIENDNDQPHRIQVTQQVLNCFEEVAVAVISSASIPVGIELLYDMPATLDLAHKIGADFVRFDVFNDDVVTQWGTVCARGKHLVNKNTAKKAKKPLILADVQVKHARLTCIKPLEESLLETISLGADAAIISGTWTGKAPSIQDLELAIRINAKPVLVGSGLNCENAYQLMKYADGAIVGTSIKSNGITDLKKAIELRQLINY